jgi:hypothetical protein
MTPVAANPRDPTLPHATLRPCLIDDTWPLRFRLAGEIVPYEACCHVCEPGDAAGRHGPDTAEACERWVERHLRQRHGIDVAHRYDTTPGNEHWPSGV